MTSTVVVFDFDHTIIDVNSDPHVVRALSEIAIKHMAGEHMEPWHEVMDEWFEALSQR